MRDSRQWRVLLAVVVLAATVEASAQLPATSSAEVEVFDYTVADGDSCSAIARRFFGDRTRYDIIHQFNPDMGPTPHHLVAGQVLRLPRVAPVRGSGPDARVTSAVLEVRAREPDVQRWQHAIRGLELFRGWRVNTLERSQAELTFRDTSVAHMRQNTLVVIYGGTARTARAPSGRAELASGTLRSRLGAMRMRFDTPVATVDLVRGSAVLRVDSDGASRVSNHEGEAATLRTLGGAGARRVRPGFGSKVLRGARPSRPQTLPPAPSWADTTAHRFVGVAGVGGTLSGQWNAVPEARIYRVEVATEPDGRGVISATEVSSDVTRFEMHRLPAGTYYLRLATIDGDFFESRPSEPWTVNVEVATLDRPGAEDDQLEASAYDPGDPSEVPAPPQVLAGTHVRAPVGVRCGESADRLGEPLSTPGRRAVVCVLADGSTAPAFEVQVVAPTIDARGLDEHGAVVRGREQDLSFVIESELPLPRDARFEIEAGAELLSQHRDDGGRVSVRLATNSDAPDSITLSLVVGGGEGRVDLGDVVLAVRSPEPIEAPAEVDTAALAPTPQEWGFAANEAFGQLLDTRLLSLRDSRRLGAGAFMAVGALGRPAQGQGHGRVAIAAEIPLGARVRAGVGGPIDVAVTEEAPLLRADRDLVAWASAQILSEDRLSVAFDLTMQIPRATGEPGAGHVHLLPSLDASYRLGEFVMFRTRQGAVLDLGVGGPLYWASAYGVDYRVAGPLVLGVEVNTAFGAGPLEPLRAVGFGPSLGLDLGVLTLSVAYRGSATNDLARLVGRHALVLGVRVAQR